MYRNINNRKCHMASTSERGIAPQTLIGAPHAHVQWKARALVFLLAHKRRNEPLLAELVATIYSGMQPTDQGDHEVTLPQEGT